MRGMIVRTLLILATISCLNNQFVQAAKGGGGGGGGGGGSKGGSTGTSGTSVEVKEEVPPAEGESEWNSIEDCKEGMDECFAQFENLDGPESSVNGSSVLNLIIWIGTLCLIGLCFIWFALRGLRRFFRKDRIDIQAYLGLALAQICNEEEQNAH